MKSPATVPPIRFRSTVVLLLAALFLGGCGSGKNGTGTLSDADRHLLDDYEQIRAALAADDAKGAKKAAAQMVTDLTPPEGSKATPSPTLEAASAVADALALDTQRQRFEILSDRVVPMVKGVQGYYVLTSDLPNTVPWVQRTTEVDNPFFGKAMHHLGELKK